MFNFFYIDCGVVDIFIIIDDSNGSEGFNNFNMMKIFVKEIIKDLNLMFFRFSVLCYSSFVLKMFGFIEFFRFFDVILSIDCIWYFFGIFIDIDKVFKYVWVLIFNSKRVDVVNIIILFMDGFLNNLNKIKVEFDLLWK